MKYIYVHIPTCFCSFALKNVFQDQKNFETIYVAQLFHFRVKSERQSDSNWVT